MIRLILNLKDRKKKRIPSVLWVFCFFAWGGISAWANERVILPLSRLSVEVDSREWRQIHLRREDRAGGIEGYWIHRQSPHRTRMILSQTVESRPQGGALQCFDLPDSRLIRKKIHEWDCLVQTQPLTRSLAQKVGDPKDATSSPSGPLLVQWQTSRVREVPLPSKLKAQGFQKLWVKTFAIEQSHENRPDAFESWLKSMRKVP